VQANLLHPLVRAAALLSIAALARNASAAVRYVALCGNDGWSGTAINCLAPTGPKRTIQAAINSSVDGDTIVVLAGTYVGAIDLDGKEITLVSASGPAFTFLTRVDNGSIMTCNSAETADTVIQGFTIEDGFSLDKGAALRCVLSTPSFIDCVFEGNIAMAGGGAVSVTFASPSFTNCAFKHNQNDVVLANTSGGAVLVEQGHPTFTDCLFLGNEAANIGGAVAVLDGAQADFDGCDFEANRLLVVEQATHGGAIGCAEGEITVHDCTFIENLSAGEGGAIGLEDAVATIEVSTFGGNVATFLHAGAIRAVDSDVSIVGCEFEYNLSNGYGAALTAVFSDISIALCGFHDNGHALPGIAGPSTRGGAVWASYSTTSIVASTFIDNNAEEDGGAITIGGYPYDDYPASISGCTFTGNEAMDEGGAISITTGNATVGGSSFTGNSSHFGGAIRCYRYNDGPEYPPSHFDLHDCTFTDNGAFTAGAVHLKSDGTITACDFLGNHAENIAGALDVLMPAEATVRECLFDGNSAASGGGMAAGSSGCRVIDCQFTNNSATTGGGLIATVATQTAYVANSIFHHNTSVEEAAAAGVGSGGGLRFVNSIFHHNTAAADGAAIWNFSGSIDLANCTIANNVGGGVLAGAFAGDTTIANSIVWGNTSGAEIAGEVTSIRSSNVQGGIDGEGNMDINPKFAGALLGNYKLLGTSPCIDAGLNWLARTDVLDLDGDGIENELTPVDFEGNPRIADAAARDTGCGLGAVVDLGAFEVAGTPAGNSIYADLNGDGAVGPLDLAILLGAWGVGDCIADLDGDGSVGASDLAILLGAWG
jgi:predicted outer membrane repeat protein